jgi:hypothetical protein
MEGIMEGNVKLDLLPPLPLLPLPPPPLPLSTRPVFIPHPPTPPIVTIPKTLSSPASDPIDFASTPDYDVGTIICGEEQPSPKWPQSHTPPSLTSEDDQSLKPETEEEEQVDQLADDGGNESDEVEFVEEGNLQEMVGIVEVDDIMLGSGKVVKGKGRAVEDRGEGMIEESVASVRSFLLWPGIEELMKDLGLESGSGEEIRGIEVRTTAKEKKASLLSRLLKQSYILQLVLNNCTIASRHM